LLFLFLLAGCDSIGDPIGTCDNFPASDCCRTDEQCMAFYDDLSAPWCHLPDREEGGTCSQCVSAADCWGGHACDVDENGQGRCWWLCEERGVCYEGED